MYLNNGYNSEFIFTLQFKDWIFGKLDIFIIKITQERIIKCPLRSRHLSWEKKHQNNWFIFWTKWLDSTRIGHVTFNFIWWCSATHNTVTWWTKTYITCSWVMLLCHNQLSIKSHHGYGNSPASWGKSVTSISPIWGSWISVRIWSTTLSL